MDRKWEYCTMVATHTIEDWETRGLYPKVQWRTGKPQFSNDTVRPCHCTTRLRGLGDVRLLHRTVG